MTPNDDVRINTIHDTVLRIDETINGKMGLISKIEDHECRIRSINNKVNYFSGLVATVGIGLGAIINKIFK